MRTATAGQICVPPYARTLSYTNSVVNCAASMANMANMAIWARYSTYDRKSDFSAMSGSMTHIPWREEIDFASTLAQFRELVREGVDRLYLAEAQDQRALKAMVGICGSTTYLPLSDTHVRAEAGRLLTPALVSCWRAPPQPSLFFISVGGDLGNTFERNPDIRLSAFRRKIHWILDKLKLHAVFVLEVQALTNFPLRGAGGTFMLNAHICAWTNIPFDHEKAERDLSRALQCTFDMSPVVIQPVNPSAADIERCCRYMLKPPTVGKFIRKVPGREWFGVEFASAAVRPNIAVRLAEVLSQIKLTEAIGGAGEGKAIVAGLRRQLKAWDAQRPRGGPKRRPRIESAEAAAAVWQRVRGDHPGRVERSPVRIHRSGPVETPTRWQLAAEQAMVKFRPRGAREI